MADNAKVIAALNELIETCRDGQEGFRTAAEGVTRTELKTLFYDLAQERARFVGELQTDVRRLGGDPEDTGSVAASLHRGWMNIRGAVAGSDDAAIVAECERGEDTAVASYRGALEIDLPAHIRSVVERQYAEVKKAHDRIRALERGTGAGA